ncbi:hypothetical protein [Actinoplanes regularis]|uniref:hypothetical protein n=1 Tax=Actinoplanes regularis TaxID=52697 RepID=UPI0024A26DC3|nr:hypothetical protein [Actinoplanes regularis]GLW35483.1 hypothetical protein Areg01_84180 [Actinoplanes regularis]
MSDPGQQTPPQAAPPADPSGVGSPPGSEAAAEPIEIQQAPFNLLSDDQDERPESESLTPARRRTRTIVLSSLLAVGVAGIGLLGWFSWQINSQRNVVLNPPARVGDLTLDTSENAHETADYLQTALSAEVDLDKTVGAVYTGGAEKDVLFFGGTTVLWSPEKDLETSFELISDEQGAVTGLHDVDAGSLGGTMKCGTTKTESGDLSVCGWADHGSLALAMFPNRPESEAAPLMRQLREAIQTRD